MENMTRSAATGVLFSVSTFFNLTPLASRKWRRGVLNPYDAKLPAEFVIFCKIKACCVIRVFETRDARNCQTLDFYK